MIFFFGFRTCKGKGQASNRNNSKKFALSIVRCKQIVLKALDRGYFYRLIAKFWSLLKIFKLI